MLSGRAEDCVLSEIDLQSSHYLEPLWLGDVKGDHQQEQELAISPGRVMLLVIFRRKYRGFRQVFSEGRAGSGPATTFQLGTVCR